MAQVQGADLLKFVGGSLSPACWLPSFSQCRRVISRRCRRSSRHFRSKRISSKKWRVRDPPPPKKRKRSRKKTSHPVKVSCNDSKIQSKSRRKKQRLPEQRKRKKKGTEQKRVNEKGTMNKPP